jgi:glucokinase
MDQPLLGIEIGGTKLQIVSGDTSGAIRERRRFHVDVSRGAAGIRSQIEAVIKDIPAKAIGVGFGGPVDWQTGQICCSHQIEGWAGFSLGEWLASISGVPVRVDNDANLAALGEATRGAGVGFNPLFYVTLGSGVGGGLIIDNKIYHGAKPGESEIGHIRLDRNGTILESRCSGWAVDAKIRKLKETGADSILCKVIGEEIGGEARHLARALQENDAAALEILHDTAEDLAFGLSHVTHLFHPEVIVLGGGLSLLGEPLRAAVAKELPQFIMKVFGEGPQTRLAALGEDAVPTGALIAAGQIQY